MQNNIKNACNFDNQRLKISLEKFPSSPPPILLFGKAQKWKFGKTKKNVEKYTFKIISIQKYIIYNFKGFLGIKSIKETL
jgi:hypothetical protein